MVGNVIDCAYGLKNIILSGLMRRYKEDIQLKKEEHDEGE